MGSVLSYWNVNGWNLKVPDLLNEADAEPREELLQLLPESLLNADVGGELPSWDWELRTDFLR